MSSTATDSLKEVVLSLFKTDLDSADVPYYMGLSNVEDFIQPTDIANKNFQRKFRDSLLAVKTISNAALVVPNIEWTQNNAYPAYTEDGERNFYVVNSLNEVFVCIEQGKNPDGTTVTSQIEPTATLAANQAKTFKTGDGYLWRFLYRLSNLLIASYKTNNYIPVQFISDRSEFLPIGEDTLQRQLQDSAVAGEIIGMAIDSAGFAGEYEVAPTISINGNGTAASFSCDINGGKITRVKVDSDGNGIFLHGSGYDYAATTVSVGTAKLRPILSPQKGINANPIDTLQTNSLMIQTDFQDNEFDTILDVNDFSQIGILRGITKYSNDSDFSANTAIACKSLTGVSISSGGPFVEDETFTDGTGTAIGKIVHHDTIGNILYYYQDQTTGYVAFDNTLNNGISTGSTTASFSGEQNPSLNNYSGDILYINNINADATGASTVGISRESTQTEDIRIVIQLG